MAFVAAATLGAGLLGAGASMYGANRAANASSSAAREAAALQREAMGYQKENYGRASANLDPFIRTGQGANGLLGSFYGLNGSDPALGQNALERFRQSPDYQFALREGGTALDNSAAARGGVLGGNQIRAQTEFGQGLATQNLGNYLTRLSSMSGQGIQAGGYLGSIGTGSGNSVGASSLAAGNAMMGAGTAEAAGINGMVGGFHRGLSSLQQYGQMNRSSYGGGGYTNPDVMSGFTGGGYGGGGIGSR